MDFELVDLIAYLAKLKDPEMYDSDNEENLEDLEEFIREYYGIGIDNFTELIRDLLPLCNKAESMIFDKVYQGFGTGTFWLLKREVK